MAKIKKLEITNETGYDAPADKLTTSSCGEVESDNTNLTLVVERLNEVIKAVNKLIKNES